jgi:hypothetical protein
MQKLKTISILIITAAFFVNVIAQQMMQRPRQESAALPNGCTWKIAEQNEIMVEWLQYSVCIPGADKGMNTQTPAISGKVILYNNPLKNDGTKQSTNTCQFTLCYFWKGNLVRQDNVELSTGNQKEFNFLLNRKYKGSKTENDEMIVWLENFKQF